MIQSWPKGSQVVLPFYFVSRTLTAAEKRTFNEGLGLPPGVGKDVEVVTVEYFPPDEAGQVISGGGIIHDGTGMYHAVLECTLGGTWTWRGVGKTSGGTPVAATVDQMFQITQSRSA